MALKVFDSYARYYDTLNQSKNYAEEANYVHQLMKQNMPHAKELLEFGCGTGIHAAELAKFGYHIHGVDQSQAMLTLAESRRLSLPEEQKRRLIFSQADIRHLNLKKKFDAVIALFHVVSYLTGNADLLATFRIVSDHLKPGGVFLFDCWYGPGVLTERPTVRVREWEDDGHSIIRIAEPMLHPNENVVDVNYRIFIYNKASGKREKFSEMHRMRYLFMPEIEMLMEISGMKIRSYQEWNSDRAVGFDSWMIAVAASI